MRGRHAPDEKEPVGVHPKYLRVEEFIAQVQPLHQAGEDWVGAVGLLAFEIEFHISGGARSC